MRAGTLFEPETAEYLSRHFILVTHNQLPELYCGKGTIDTTAQYSSEHIQVVKEGAGGGNVRSYFCTPDGKVVNYVAGFWKPQRYRAEADWALEQIKKDVDAVLTRRKSPSNTDLAQAHQEVTASYTKERDETMSPAEIDRIIRERITSGKDDALPKHQAVLLSRVRALNRLIRSHREATDLLDLPILSVLQKVEREIYTKGSLGCDS